jgi:hypothetical protein
LNHIGKTFCKRFFATQGGSVLRRAWRLFGDDGVFSPATRPSKRWPYNGDILILGGEMGQTETAAQCGTATSALSLAFASNGRAPKTIAGGATATLDGAETPATILPTETLRWKELTYKDRTFVFNRELEIRVTQEEGGCAYDSDDLGLFGFGNTRTEAEHVFCLDFASSWDDIASEEDGRLTKDARETKRAILALVKSQR